MAEKREHSVMLNEGIRVQNVSSCLLCGSEGVLLYQNLRDRLFSAPGTWSPMRCPNCHLVWLNPRPVTEDIGKLYEDYFTHDIANPNPNPGVNQGLIYRLLKNCLKRFLYFIGLSREMAEMEFVLLNTHLKGKILDVGCGNGRFLANMRDLGWEVVGVEPDSQAVKIAREQFGLTVHEGTLEEAGFADDTFDAITMSHVIEHVPDPVRTLSECRRVLKKGGKLVVITPNIESLGHRMFREAWFGIDAPRHLHLFSPHTLHLCTKQAGLRALQLRTTARLARRMWAASYLIRRNGALPGCLPQNPSLLLRGGALIFQVIEHGLCRVKDVGEELVLIGEK